VFAPSAQAERQGNRVNGDLATSPSPSGGGSDGEAVRGGVKGRDSGFHPLPIAFGDRPPLEGEVKRPLSRVSILHPIAAGRLRPLIYYAVRSMYPG